MLMCYLLIKGYRIKKIDEDEQWNKKFLQKQQLW